MIDINTQNEYKQLLLMIFKTAKMMPSEITLEEKWLLEMSIMVIQDKTEKLKELLKKIN